MYAQVLCFGICKSLNMTVQSLNLILGNSVNRSPQDNFIHSLQFVLRLLLPIKELIGNDIDFDLYHSFLINLPLDKFLLVILMIIFLCFENCFMAMI